MLFCFTALLLDWYKLLLPKCLFAKVYAPSSEVNRGLEQGLLNEQRRIIYLLKRKTYRG